MTQKMLSLMAKTAIYCSSFHQLLLLMSMSSMVSAWSPLPKVKAVVANDQQQLQSPLNSGTRELRMPGVVPQKDDDYVCAAFKVDEDEELYITQFRVEGSAERAHHMILSGCGDVPSEASNPSWNCGSHGTCRGHSSVLFAWAKNAPGTTLPPQVGFRIGGKRSKVKYVVVQVHYARKLEAGERDYSGMDLEVTSEPQKYLAGIFLLLSTPTIPPGEPKVHSDSMCPVEMTSPAKIFAARVHAHALGTVITGYRHDGKTNQVEEVARGNPQWPQAFYATKKEIEIEKGDTLLVRCTYNSTTRSTFTHTGGTANDEMCNMYLMYYTDAEKGVAYESCGYLPGARETAWFPADSDEQLPPNPILDAYALHGAHYNRNNNNNNNNDNKEPFPATPLTAEKLAAKLLQQQQQQDEHSSASASSIDHHHNNITHQQHQHTDLPLPLSTAAGLSPSSVTHQRHSDNNNPQMDTMTLNRVHYKQIIGGPPPPESVSSDQQQINTNTRNHPSANENDDSVGLVIRVEDSADEQANINKKQQQETVVVLTLPVDKVSDFLQQYQLQPRQQQQDANFNPSTDVVAAGGLSFRRANIRPHAAVAALPPNFNHFNNNYYYQHPYYYQDYSPLSQFYRHLYRLP